MVTIAAPHLAAAPRHRHYQLSAFQSSFEEIGNIVRLLSNSDFPKAKFRFDFHPDAKVSPGVDLSEAVGKQAGLTGLDTHFYRFRQTE